MSLEAKGRQLEAMGKRVPFLDGPPMPLEAEHVWGWFLDLHSGRGAGFSHLPISWSDMAGYFALHGITPRSWELKTLRAMDSAWMEANQTKTETEG